MLRYFEVANEATAEELSRLFNDQAYPPHSQSASTHLFDWVGNLIAIPDDFEFKCYVDDPKLGEIVYLLGLDIVPEEEQQRILNILKQPSCMLVDIVPTALKEVSYTPPIQTIG